MTELNTHEHEFRRARRLSGLEVSPILQIEAEVRRRNLRGMATISLCAGEPDFPTPPAIIDVAKRAMDEGHTRYTSVCGTPTLKTAIALENRRIHGWEPAAEAIICCAGVKQVISNALLASLDPGDEVLVPAPCWASYRDMISLAGGHAVLVPTHPESDFRIDATEVEARITPRTRWLLLNSPCNPTGAVSRRSELDELASVLRRHKNVWVITDDIYREITYLDERLVGFGSVAPDLRGRLLIADGVSKSFSMTGWRIGWGIGPIALIHAMAVVQSQTTSCPNAIAQYAAAYALSGSRTDNEFRRREYLSRRNLVLRELSEVPGIRAYPPDGGFFIWIDCSKLIGSPLRSGGNISDDGALCELFMRHGVALAPGSAFGLHGYIRLSFATSAKQLIEGCRRMARAVGAVGPQGVVASQSGRGA
ncbi:pyridoxal phosphate-dependent aminotransferase [Gluconacetobacter sacchari]|uniref:Aminotransferase n=1 Tax=Gluconacetobacter sacchari TaxID=92759 RepID=A0A7W4IHD7_9PROT|nr:pyridoxal phosphate-dependent aminotransferase [Gluconacetobacter sacchari]MBB2162784.1 pyridoxal phosphate-dependent aminotransferase [Gluconacetobacter sacchari]